MNRRSFITKALAGLAAVPLIGKLARSADTHASGDIVVTWRDRSGDWPRNLQAFAVYEANDHVILHGRALSEDEAWEIYVHNRKLADAAYESRKGRV